VILSAKLIPQAEMIRRVAVEVEAVWPGCGSM
jgi:hypothetical protein